MSIETSIYTALAAESTITDLVSTRIYPSIAPADADFPAIVFEKYSHDVQVYLDRSVETTNTQYFRFHILASTYASMAGIRDALRSFLSGKYGSFGGDELSPARLLTEVDGYDDESSLFHSISDYRLDIIT